MLFLSFVIYSCPLCLPLSHSPSLPFIRWFVLVVAIFLRMSFFLLFILDSVSLFKIGFVVECVISPLFTSSERYYYARAHTHIIYKNKMQTLRFTHSRLHCVGWNKVVIRRRETIDWRVQNKQRRKMHHYMHIRWWRDNRKSLVNCSFSPHMDSEIAFVVLLVHKHSHCFECSLVLLLSGIIVIAWPGIGTNRMHQSNIVSV